MMQHTVGRLVYFLTFFLYIPQISVSLYIISLYQLIWFNIPLVSSYKKKKLKYSLVSDNAYIYFSWTIMYIWGTCMIYILFFS